MNIQIFGTSKSADTRKAQRFFKERGIRFQMIDLNEKGFSRGELQSVCRAIGGVDALIDPNARDKELLALLPYLSPEDRFEKLLENPTAILQPVVRNGQFAAAGYRPEVWKTWK